MAGEQKPSSSLLEQFILLAKGMKGSALPALINQVLEAPGVYVFGELLDLPTFQELADGPNAGYVQLLNLFAYGTYSDYIANKASLPELSALKNKLKHLTIVSLASRMKCIPYSVLELEDLIIEAIYTDIFQGKLDQRNHVSEVDFCIGRDIPKKDISSIVKTLQEWCDGCEAVANQYKENHNRTQQQIDRGVQCEEDSESNSLFICSGNRSAPGRMRSTKMRSGSEMVNAVLSPFQRCKKHLPSFNGWGDRGL
uniref:PCI domain-containing protein n=1 Tax=Leptobrachium leishanense TaxID=445787 RepID=A0A8C5MIN7_9ANUR